MNPQGSCAYGHYWPGICQQCDTAWNAVIFACQIAGHLYDSRDASCVFCDHYREQS